MKVERERIDTLLVKRELVPTREKARALILAGEVVVNDHRVDKPGTRVPADASVRLKRAPDEWVGRGAHKLIGALDHFGIDLTGRIAIDVGASTGGFTQVMLERGATLVHAVDVGRNQLAWKLRQDSRVKVYEGLNFRYAVEGDFEPEPEFASADVSFISLRLILPALALVLREGSEAVVLVKPQFELGPEHVGKGGIVRHPAARAQALQEIMLAATQCGFRVKGSVESPITGTDGNIEYFLYLQRGARL